MFKITMVMSFLAGFVVKCDDPNYYIVEVSKEAERVRRPFYIYWNVPTMQCKSKGIHFAGLYEKFGIIQNGNDKFLGDKMVILYDPGLFPALFKNESDGKLRFRNGGVPQDGNLTEHMEAFESSVARLIPDVNFDGVAVIDFESWRPVFKQNYGVLTPYKDISYDLERKRHPWWLEQWVKHEAERRFEEAGRKFMEVTLSMAKQLRSKARWGYYGFPYCFNADHRDQCSRDTMQENDRCRWLWSMSDALFPSVYSSKSLSTDQLKTMIRGRVKEAARVVEKSAGILPYVWFRQRDGEYFEEKDLKAIFNTIYNTDGSSGVIIWGSSSDVNTKRKCENLYEYIYTKFGPLVSKYAKYDTRFDENKVTEGDNLVSDTNTADTNIIVTTTTTENNNELEFVINLQEGPEGTINVVQPIEAVHNSGIENSNVEESKPIHIEGSNVTSSQIVNSNPNKPDSEAAILFQQLNGLTIIDLLNKMFGKNVIMTDGTIYAAADNLKKAEAKTESFTEVTKPTETKSDKANYEIDLKDIFDFNSDENHIITTDLNSDYDFTTQEYQFTTPPFSDDIGVIEKGIHFIDNVQDVFQNIHKDIEKITPTTVMDTSTKIIIRNTDLKNSIRALKEIFSELRQKNLTSETGDLFNFLDTYDNPQVTHITTENPEAFDVLNVITEANDIFPNEKSETIITDLFNDLELTTEYDPDFLHVLIPIRDKNIIKPYKTYNRMFRINDINYETTTPDYYQVYTETISKNNEFQTTENTPIKDNASNIDKNVDTLSLSRTIDNIESTTSQFLDDKLDTSEVSNIIFSTTEKYENLIFDGSMPMDTSTNQEITTNQEIKTNQEIMINQETTENEFSESVNIFIPIKDPGDSANNDNTTPKEPDTTFESTTLKSARNFTTNPNQMWKQNFFKHFSRKKYKEFQKLFFRMKTINHETTEQNDVMRVTRKPIKNIHFLLLHPQSSQFKSLTSQLIDSNSVNDKTNTLRERKKNYVFSDLSLNNQEDFNWIGNNYIPQGIASKTKTVYEETTTKTNILTTIPGFDEDDVNIKNFLNELESSASHPLADIMSDITIKSGENLANDPEFSAVLSNEVRKLSENKYTIKLNEKPVLYDAARKDLAKGVNKGNHFLYPEKPIQYEEATTNEAYYSDNSNNYYPNDQRKNLADPYSNKNLDQNLAENAINNLYSEEFNTNIDANNTRKARTLQHLLEIHNASYPHSFRDKKADKSIENILKNELDIDFEEEKDVKRDVLYDKREFITNFYRINENLTTALKLEKPFISDATNNCNQNQQIMLILVLSYSIAKCLCEVYGKCEP